MEDLKPCPFCGNKVRLNGEQNHTWWITCQICDYDFDGIDGDPIKTIKENIIKRWNTRHKLN